MPSFDVENRWTFVATVVVVWVITWSIFEVVLFDGDMAVAVISAIAGGLASGFVLFHFRQSAGE